MELKLNNPESLVVDRKKDGSTSLLMPSTGVSLIFNAKEKEMLDCEVDRFLKETIAHTRYVLNRFKTQHTFLASYIKTLRHEGYWDVDGFTNKALLNKALLNKRVGLETAVETLLDSMAAAFCFSKKLRSFMDDLPVKTIINDELNKWPSIMSTESLPSVEEEEYKGEWQVPLRFTSSSILAGMVKPVIFFDGSLDIALNSGRVKLHLKEGEGVKLISQLINTNDLAKFETAKRAWFGLSELEVGVRRFIGKLKENGYNSELEYFDPASLNVEGIHEALVELDKGLVGEANMIAINESYKQAASN